MSGEKKSDPSADVSALESEIDQMVYKLYGLTEEEIKIVALPWREARRSKEKL